VSVPVNPQAVELGEMKAFWANPSEIAQLMAATIRVVLQPQTVIGWLMLYAEPLPLCAVVFHSWTDAGHEPKRTTCCQ
jgi:hypothetical protein